MRETPTHTLFISEVRAVTHVNRDILAATPVVLREFRRQFSRAANSVSEHSNIQDFSCGIGRPRRSATSPSILDQYLIANQIAMAMIATTIAPHSTGVTCFELPLRGESLAAWLNS